MANYRVRWMVKEDLPQVCRIAALRDESVFYKFLGRSGLVACTKSRVLGYLVFSPRSEDHAIVRVQVAVPYRRRGIGRTLLQSVQQLRGPLARRKLVATCRETNLAAQLCLQACGFVCSLIVRRHYQNPPADGYAFTWEKSDA